MVALVLALPMLIYGPMVRGHDTYEHLNSSKYFAEQFWGGELYPRWLMSMHHGLGSASFFIYPPLLSYVYAFIYPLGKAFHFDAFKIQAFLALFASAVCVFLWLSTMSSRKVAVLSAALYMLMPYHLAVDFYRRTALPECWALAWMPLVLYFSVNAMKGNAVAIVGLAVAYALLILSHPITLIIFSLIPLAAALVLAGNRERIQSVSRVALGMAVGTGLSCFYLLSALFDSRFFPASRLLAFTNYNLTDNLIGVTDLYAGSSGITHTIALTLVDMTAFIAICAAVALKDAVPQSKKIVSFWLALSAVPIFLMTTLSFPFWKMLTWIHGAVQFPWRLNILLCVTSLPMLAAFLSKALAVRRFREVLPVSLVFLLVVTWTISYAQVWKRYRVETFTPPSQIFSYDDDWFVSWSAPDLDSASALYASTQPRARFTTGTGTVNVLLWKPRSIELQTDSQTAGLVMVNQFYYPQWRALLLDAALPLEIVPAMPEGVLQVKAPAGSQRIRLEIPVDASERAGRWISAFSAFLCLIFLWPPAWQRLMSIHRRSSTSPKS